MAKATSSNLRASWPAAVLALMAIPSATPAQTVASPIVASGACEAKSSVTVDGEVSDYGCDTVIIGRTERGTVLIQFSDKTGDDGRILAFGGTIEGKQGFGVNPVQLMAVERVYLTPGEQPMQAKRGTCFLNWTGLVRTGGRLKSVVCGGRGNADGHDVMAMVTLKTADAQ